MTPKLPILRPDKIIRVLKRNGLVRIKRSSGHAEFRHPDGRWAKVPVHGQMDVGRGLFSRILKSSRKKVNEFL
jgi:predicted RNA binding protein YcfA (HicA-like mRNA interferase family)